MAKEKTPGILFIKDFHEMLCELTHEEKGYLLDAVYAETYPDLKDEIDLTGEPTNSAIYRVAKKQLLRMTKEHVSAFNERSRTNTANIKKRYSKDSDGDDTEDSTENDSTNSYETLRNSTTGYETLRNATNSYENLQSKKVVENDSTTETSRRKASYEKNQSYKSNLRQKTVVENDSTKIPTYTYTYTDTLSDTLTEDEAEAEVVVETDTYTEAVTEADLRRTKPQKWGKTCGKPVENSADHVENSTSGPFNAENVQILFKPQGSLTDDQLKRFNELRRIKVGI